ncbi:MAG: PSD1 and planctomycete cytochrome C domain-containing protein [Verrucomicrobiales bacterium]
MKVWVAAFPVLVLCQPPARAAAVDFAREIQPILSENCFQCHGPDSKERKADLRFDTREGAFRIKDGRAVIVAGRSAESELLRRLLSQDEDEQMPPPNSNRHLTPAQIALIKQWVDEGAVWAEHWAFTRPQRPALPGNLKEGSSQSRLGLSLAPPCHPIDAFIGQRLGQEGLAFSLEAPRATLIRRVTLDLTGLPPTPEEVDGFLNDSSPQSYRKLVDRLLKSPRYGERMVWEWLEAARYADTNGYQGDPTRSMHYWRDWCIKALNDNMPFDQFTLWQIAGDLLPQPSQEQLIATGFHRNHMLNGEGGRIPEESRVDYVQDRVETTGAVWLGLTLNCCRCHDHKFDPFTQRDYYQFAAYFNSIDESGATDAHPFARPVLDLGSPEYDAKLAEAKQREEAARAAADADRGSGWTTLDPVEFSSAHGATLARREDGAVVVSGVNPLKDTFTVTVTATLPTLTALRIEALPDDTLVNRGPGRADNGNYVLTEVRVDGAEFSSAEVDFSQNDTHRPPTLFDKDSETGWAVMPRFGERHEAVLTFSQPLEISPSRRLAIRLDCLSGHPQHVLGCFRLSATDAAQPKLSQPGAETKKRLDEARKARESVEKSAPKTMVMRDLPQPRPTYILERGSYDKQRERVEPATPAALPALPGNAPKNRLALAHWMVSPGNPLTGRVAVNREWAKFFGTGLVKTAEDFGVQGERPSHPELLDWLAVDFVESGWDLKQLHRLIVTSAAYRQASQVTAALAERDPGNRLLARGPRFRLPSWMLRDQALAVSGLLVEELGGAAVKPYQPPGVWEDATFGQIGYQQDRGQALYRRSLYTFWRRIVAPTMFFDVASRQTCAVKTGRTNTPLHALITLNETTFVEAARHLARQLLLDPNRGTDERRLSQAFRACTARTPSIEEMRLLVSALDRLRRNYFADPQAAEKLINVGESKPPPSLAPVELAAWTGVCSMLLNLDETLNKE